jgi:aspartate ammonia-lyase
MSGQSTRVERDLLGEKAVPADAYYGVQTARGLENFHISGVELRLYPDLIAAFAMVKMAAARANVDCGQFSKEILKGIEGACQELIDGKLHDQFRLDMFQGGAGTSTNMNANEVIANRALELMGHKKGEYKYCDPHDHVNRSQSTNDSYPTAMHVGMALGNAEIVAAYREPEASMTQSSLPAPPTVYAFQVTCHLGHSTPQRFTEAQVRAGVLPFICGVCTSRWTSSRDEEAGMLHRIVVGELDSSD